MFSPPCVSPFLSPFADLVREIHLDANLPKGGRESSQRARCLAWVSEPQGEAGSQLLEAGVPIHEVGDALGHSSTTMTSTYLRTRSNSLAKAYEPRDVHRARKALRLASTGQSMKER